MEDLSTQWVESECGLMQIDGLEKEKIWTMAIMNGLASQIVKNMDSDRFEAT